MHTKLENRLRIYRLIFLFSTIEGIVTVAFLFTIPSETQSAWLLGYSRSRLAIVIIALMCVIGTIVITIKSLLGQDWLIRLDTQLIEWLQTDHHLLSLTTLLIFFLLVGIGIMVLFLPEVKSSIAEHSWVWEDVYSKFTPVYDRLEALIFWGLTLAFQSQTALFIFFQPKYRKTIFWKPSIIFQTLLPPFIILATIFHWLILFFHLYIFTVIPHWFWKFYQKPTRHDYVEIVLILIGLLVVGMIIKFPKWRFNVLLVIGLGYTLIIGFGFVEDKGFETLQQQYYEKGRREYVEFACSQTSILEPLRNFEEIARANTSFFNTKPPGVFGFHLLINRISGARVSTGSLESCVEDQIRFMSYTFPLLAMLTLVPLYYLCRPLLGEDTAILALALYVFIPNVILTPLYLDQSLYPLLFIIGAYFSYQMINKKTFAWSFITGAWAFISAYFSFSLLPTIFFSAAWFMIDYLFNYKQRTRNRIFISSVGLAVGFLSALGLFSFFLNYDFLLRYTTAMAAHREHKEFQIGIQSIWEAAIVNNVEFTAWIGFPITILFLSHFFHTTARWLKKRITSQDIAFLAFFTTYIALNILGQTRSEVARLWLFLVPMISIFASVETRNLFKKPSIGFLMVTLLQLVTMILTFKLQDLD